MDDDTPDTYEALPALLRRNLLVLGVGLLGYLTALMLIVLALSPSFLLWIATVAVPALVGWREARTTDSNWRVKSFAVGFAVSVLATSLALDDLITTSVSPLRFLLVNLFFTGTEATLAMVCGFTYARARAKRTAA